jgi:two-component system, OmpR family, response regulator
VHILLIEDDPETATHIATGLRAEGHVLHVEANGADGLNVAIERHPDLMIVDRMLPGLDGISVVKALRARGSRAPVLFLTALSRVSDRVEGLEAGADDYLTKPFSFAELRARVHALARRPPLAEELVELTVCDLRMDRLRRRVTRGREVIDLQPREYELLDYLMTRAGSIVTRRMLLEEIWNFHFDPGTNIVETHICRLRAKIDRGGGRPLIETVRGAGYVIRVE